MKYLCIDYGTRRIGLAVSAAGLAFPHDSLNNDDGLFKALTDIIQNGHIDALVVGDTRSYGGRENTITQEAESFIEKLKQTGIPVMTASEAGSSAEAARLNPEQHDDASAAAIILQRFLDSNQG